LVRAWNLHELRLTRLDFRLGKPVFVTTQLVKVYTLCIATWQPAREIVTVFAGSEGGAQDQSIHPLPFKSLDGRLGIFLVAKSHISAAS
jgi:hypothetical protein